MKGLIDWGEAIGIIRIVAMTSTFVVFEDSLYVAELWMTTKATI